MTLTHALPATSPTTWNFQLPVCDDQPYLIEAKEAQVLDDTDCTDACLAHDLTRHLQADFDNLQRVGEHHLRAARLHNSSHYHEWDAQDARVWAHVNSNNNKDLSRVQFFHKQALTPNQHRP